MSLIFPLSNKISGPIDGDVMPAIGSGNWSGIDEENYCENYWNSESSVNENSVARIPARVWATLLVVNGIWIVSRLV